MRLEGRWLVLFAAVAHGALVAGTGLTSPDRGWTGPVADFLFANLAVGFAAWRWSSLLLRDEATADRLLAAVVVFLALVTTALTALGAAGLLSRPLVLLAADALAAGAALVPPRPGCVTAPEPGGSRVGPGIVALATLWVARLTPGELLRPPWAWDALAYHLHFALRFLRSGSLEAPALAYGDLSAPFFPFGGTLLFSWALAPLERSDFLARFAPYPLALLLPWLVYRWSRRLGVPATLAALPAAALATIPFLHFESRLGPAAQGVDLFLAFHLVSAGFLATLAAAGGSGALLGALGAAAGLAAGTKPFGALMALAPALVGVWAALRGPGRARRLLWLGLPLLALGAPPYARNLLLTGNPLYPIRISAGAAVLFPGPLAWDEFRAAFHGTGGFPLREVLGPNWAFGPLWPLLGLVWGGSAFLVLRAGGGPGRLLAVLFPLWIFACVLLLPERSPRFLYAGVLGTAPAIALALHRLFGARGSSGPSPHAIGARGVAVLAGGAAVLALIGLPMLIGRYQAERSWRWSEFEYRFFGLEVPLGRGWAALDRLAPPGSRIAWCGLTPPYPLAGPRLENHVVHVPPSPEPRFRGRSLPPVERRLGPPEEWAGRVRSAGIDLLVVSLAGRVFPEEKDWADSRFPLLWEDGVTRIYAVSERARRAAHPPRRGASSR